LTAFLLDTNVISEIVRPAPEPRVLKFLARESDLWLSVVSLHELSWGAARIGQNGRRRRLSAWIDSIKARFRGRLISIAETIAEIAGRAGGQAALEGRAVAPLDALIAATAVSRSMVLATRNGRDFERLDVSPYDPWRD
jgi:toxin FitB